MILGISPSSSPLYGELIVVFITARAEEEEETEDIVTSMDTTCTRYKMEIGPNKTKIMINNPNGFQREIKLKGQRLEEQKNFKYLGSPSVHLPEEEEETEDIVTGMDTTCTRYKMEII